MNNKDFKNLTFNTFYPDSSFLNMGGFANSTYFTPRGESPSGLQHDN